MKSLISRVMASCGTNAREYLATSGWLYDTGSEQRRRLLAEYEAQYFSALAACVATMGATAQQYALEKGQSAPWYPEAIRLACWSTGPNTLFLALEHHDKEAPIAVVLGCLSPAEIEQLSA